MKVKKLLGLLFMSLFFVLSCKSNINEKNNAEKNERENIEEKGNFITAEYKPDSNIKAENIAANGSKKTIVIYFSRSGNTKYIAEYIKNKLGADIFEVTTVNEYPKEYRAATDQAKRELRDNYLPEIKGKVENLADYDRVIFGYPIWWGTIPQAMKKFLLDNDLSGKTIAPFCTHGGSGISASVSDISKAAKNAKVTEGIAISGSAAKSSQKEIDSWLIKIGITDK